MLRILSTFVIFHWAVLFSVLSFLCVLSGDDGATQALRLMGMTVGQDPLFPVLAPAATAVLSLMFAISAVLFWWAVLTSIFSADGGRQDHDVVVMAFASACGALTAVFLYGAAQAIGGLCVAVAVHMCALMASYAAIVSSGSAMPEGMHGRERDGVATARARASQASHAVSLSRFSARPSSGVGEAKK